MKKIFMPCLIAATLVLGCQAENNSANREIVELKKTGRAFSSIAKKVSPAVVQIQIEKDVVSRSNDIMSQSEFLRRFFGQQYERPQKKAPKKQREVVGQGSGFIISEEGYILTNNHVIGEADIVNVLLKDGRKFTAKVIGTDPKSDVAVIKITAKDLPVLKLGNSTKLEVGEWVLALGNPFGLSHTLTAGIVSAKGRNAVGISDYEDFIQTDAAINPGNSGGPLVNLDGEAVGINTAIFSRSGGYMGIGFAIPIDMVRKIKNQLIANGKVNRGFLGVLIQELTPELAESFNTDHGILISQVEEASPAEKAGLKAGDIISSFQENKINDVSSFRNAVALENPGSKCSMVILRTGKKITLEVEIGSRTNAGTEKAKMNFGFEVEEITPENASQFRLRARESGIVISAVEDGSLAAQKGLQAGMIIREINHKRITDKKSFNDAISNSDEQLLLLISSHYGARYILLKK